MQSGEKLDNLYIFDGGKARDRGAMTVTYSLEVSRTKLGGFAKLLLRWRGSIYRLMYREMIIFTVLYYAVAILYRFMLPEAHKRRVFRFYDLLYGLL